MMSWIAGLYFDFGKRFHGIDGLFKGRETKPMATAWVIRGLSHYVQKPYGRVY